MIFFMIGLRYHPFPDTRYKLTISLVAWAACAITGMQFVGFVGQITMGGEVPDVSWFNTLFYFQAAVLVCRAKGNVVRILRVD